MKLDGALHIGVRRVGHDVGAAAGTEAFDEVEGVIRLAVDVDDDDS